MKEQPGAALVAGNGTRDGPRLGLHVDTRVSPNLDRRRKHSVPCPNTVIQSGFPGEIVHLVGRKTWQHPPRTGLTPALKQPGVFLPKLGC